jgi:hypothetical protein
MVDGDGTVTEGTYPQTETLKGGYTVLEPPSRDAALEWPTKIAVASTAFGLVAEAPRCQSVEGRSDEASFSRTEGARSRIRFGQQ